MSRQRILILALVALLVLAGLAYWVALHVESYEQDVVEDISEKARRNPFLAMERFLVRLGHQAGSSSRTEVLDEPSGRHDGIMLEFTEEVFTETRTQKLIEWIEHGGHLVLVVSAAGWEEDGLPENELLERLDLRVPEGTESDSAEDGDTVWQKAGTLYAGKQTFTIDSGFSGAWIEDGSRTAEAWKVNGVPAVLRYRLGAGRLTLVPDRDLWSNDRIGRHDHAAFLAAVFGAPRGKIWVLYHLKIDNLLQIIWRHASFAVLALSLTLMLALWGLYNRFGPLAIPESRRRRSLGEHVQAMANFAWRYGRAVSLLATARAELRHRAEVRHPGFQYRTPADQYAWLAERIPTSPAAVRDALEMKTDRPDAVVGAVILLQKLRNSL